MAGKGTVSSATRCADHTFSKSVRGSSDCATSHLGFLERRPDAHGSGAVHHLEKGVRAGHHDVGADSAAAEDPAFVLHLQGDFTLRVLAGSHVADLEVLELHPHAADALDGLEHRIHRTVADGGVFALAAVA